MAQPKILTCTQEKTEGCWEASTVKLNNRSIGQIKDDRLDHRGTFTPNAIGKKKKLTAQHYINGAYTHLTKIASELKAVYVTSPRKFERNHHPVIMYDPDRENPMGWLIKLNHPANTYAKIIGAHHYPAHIYVHGTCWLHKKDAQAIHKKYKIQGRVIAKKDAMQHWDPEQLRYAFNLKERVELTQAGYQTIENQLAENHARIRKHLKQQGFTASESNPKEELDFLRKATAEICGCQPKYGSPNIMISSECELAGLSICMNYSVLFRATQNQHSHCCRIHHNLTTRDLKKITNHA